MDRWNLVAQKKRRFEIKFCNILFQKHVYRLLYSQFEYLKHSNVRTIEGRIVSKIAEHLQVGPIINVRVIF